MGRAVSAVMALYIPFLAHENKPDNAHFVSKELWSAAKTFAQATVEFLSGGTVSIEDFDLRWKEFKNVLMKEADAFTLQMMTLMRHAAKVRRPFFGRTVGVIRMWQALAQCSKLREEKTISRRRDIGQ